MIVNEEHGVDTSWIDLDLPINELFNPMEWVYKDGNHELIVERLCYLMSRPEYFYFTCKYILNVELFPMQMVMLQELWNKKYPMIIASRGASKSFTLAVYSLLRALLIPRRRIVIVGAAFRQSKVIFNYMETIWHNAPILRDLCDRGAQQVISRNVDSFSFHINGSTITCLPLGDGEKIRGQRANDVIADEFASIPRDIFERVVAGFTTVASNPVEKIKNRAKERISKKKNIKEDLWLDNQIVLSGTAYYDFNHFAEYWKKYREWLYTKGNVKVLKEVLGGEPEEGFNWKDYVVFRVPVNRLPPGLMDDGIIARAKATVHSGTFDMEYGAIFSSDSQGFFKRSLIESCVVSKDNPVKLPSGEVFFEAKLFGDKDRRYVFGVDPASEVDHFSIVVLEIHPDHRRIVYCWTTDRQRHKEKVRKGIVSETDFYSYCARKIRDLMKVFPCDEIAMDAQGGGIAVMEALHDKDKIQPGELPIWPVIDPDKEQDTDDNPGLHVLKMCQFAKYDWLAEANHGMRKDFEDRVLLFPYFDAVTLGLAAEMDGLSGNLYDTLEDCVMDIEELKNELSIIVITQTPSGRERWDTPESKVGVAKVEKLRKDRYSALLMANMSARTETPHNPYEGYLVTGGFAEAIDPTELDNMRGKDYYDGPQWWKSNIADIF